MNHYETVFILTPVLSEEQAAETVKKFKDIIKEQGGKVDFEESWGLKKLAYPIQKKTTGFYYLLEFDAPGTTVIPLETEFRRDERVIRFLTTRMDKHHLEYAGKRRQKAADNKKAKKAEA